METPTDPASTAPATTPLRCPRCADATLTVARESLDLWGCPSCGGIWAADPPERVLSYMRGAGAAARAALQGAEQAASARRGVQPYNPERQAGIPCPRCTRPMAVQEVDARNSIGESYRLDIDLCNDHGVWFDPGEVEGVVGAGQARVQRGGLMGAVLNFFGHLVP
jgi:Zn-finger nucleic acid-binding protein